MRPSASRDGIARIDDRAQSAACALAVRAVRAKPPSASASAPQSSRAPARRVADLAADRLFRLVLGRARAGWRRSASASSMPPPPPSAPHASIQRRMASRSRDQRVERLADLHVVGALGHVAHGAPEPRLRLAPPPRSSPRRAPSAISARGGGIVEHRELAGHVRLEGKLVQQPFAEGVDGLDLQPARRLQRAWRRAAAPARISAARRRRALQLRRSPRASSASGSIVHSPSVPKTRRAISAAATLVKVRQRIAAGSAPASSSRITRCVSTCVLPEPALATTQAEDAGSDASRWMRRACGRNRAARGSSRRPPPRSVATHSATRARWS